MKKGTGNQPLSAPYGFQQDRRLEKNELQEALTRLRVSCIKKLSGVRRQQVSFYRFLDNAKVKDEDLIASFRERTTEKVKGGHVLALQDTTEFNFLWNKNRKKPGSGLGVFTNTHSLGFMVHPTLAINADTSEVYGFSHIRVWYHEGDTGTKYERDYKRLPVDKKESNKWLEWMTEMYVHRSELFTPRIAYTNKEIQRFVNLFPGHL
ncbi:hypothetical protein [Prolixibacter denitrificans]|uniref:Transposase n=1 Tax=Prolixibacter denitrificans TaxID=1541063 RepID=A0A2P8CCS2_9BACT|nr:hypothetical protein [Prolixibacter denitrificans]PSK82773.1 hypothetical protein CLV93_105165 [Prolixibacter denitrificans]GET21410.1 hypothetical protein JCM18694_16560 [Prolixibacter denitrificans]